jgi:hypothetical protein
VPPSLQHQHTTKTHPIEVQHGATKFTTSSQHQTKTHPIEVQHGATLDTKVPKLTPPQQKKMLGVQ